MSQQANDGGSAFPIPLDDRPGAYPAEPGMTLRDYFAAAALQGYIAGAMADGSRVVESDLVIVADYAFKQADAMLRAREGKAA